MSNISEFILYTCLNFHHVAFEQGLFWQWHSGRLSSKAIES